MNIVYLLKKCNEIIASPKTSNGVRGLASDVLGCLESINYNDFDKLVKSAKQHNANIFGKDYKSLNANSCFEIGQTVLVANFSYEKAYVGKIINIHTNHQTTKISVYVKELSSTYIFHSRIVYQKDMYSAREFAKKKNLSYIVGFIYNQKKQ